MLDLVSSVISEFSVLNFKDNNYSIDTKQIFFRVYRRRYLVLMVAMTWLASFCALVQTWRGKWGKFGLDIHIGSCTILPSSSGKYRKCKIIIN